MATTAISDRDRRAIEQIADEYTTGQPQPRIPGLVYGAVRNDGNPFFTYASGTIGVSSPLKMSLATVYWVASFTKVATSVSCMQLVEQGRIRLDDADQIDEIAPELRDVKVLERTAEGELTLVEKRRRITLRMLLNHTGENQDSTDAFELNFRGSSYTALWPMC